LTVTCLSRVSAVDWPEPVAVRLLTVEYDAISHSWCEVV
jgi:hypothetical protein